MARSRAGRAALTRYDPHLVEVEVEASAPAWLFLADTFDPGWSATVDGQARPIRLANAMFRAVAVPAGRHVVAFRYTPAPLAWGATVTLATGLAVLLWRAGWPAGLGPAHRSTRCSERPSMNRRAAQPATKVSLSPGPVPSIWAYQRGSSPSGSSSLVGGVQPRGSALELRP